MNHIISPDQLTIPKGEVIVKKYVRPEKVGSLYLPETSLEDTTGTLWEVVKSNEKADKAYGAPLYPGDILKVRWGHVTSLGTEDPADGRPMYIIDPEHIPVRIVNTWDPQQEKD